MLGISSENILEHSKGTSHSPPSDSDRTTTLVYNDTEPHIIRDGINRITVIPKPDNEYLVNYTGYMSGILRVTQDGIEELGDTLLATQTDVPNWLVDSPIATQTLPSWIPDNYTGPPTITCQHCHEKTPAQDIVTPNRTNGNTTNRFCRNCWNEIREQWHPEHGFDNRGE